jgi:hypothetical protein
MRAALTLTVVVAALLAGCGSDDTTATTPPPRTVPDKPPTPTQLAAIKSVPGAPIYWLGRRYRSSQLTRATLTATDPPDAIFQYGTPACEAGTGCTYPLGVATVRKRDPSSEEACWHELGAALVLACAHAPSAQVYTGDVEVFIQSSGADPLGAARALRLKTTSPTSAVTTLPAPRPFSCRQLERFPDAFASSLPAPLRPSCSS